MKHVDIYRKLDAFRECRTLWQWMKSIENNQSDSCGHFELKIGGHCFPVGIDSSDIVKDAIRARLEDYMQMTERMLDVHHDIQVELPDGIDPLPREEPSR